MLLFNGEQHQTMVSMNIFQQHAYGTSLFPQIRHGIFGPFNRYSESEVYCNVHSCPE